MVTHTNCLRNDRLQVPKQIFPVVNVWHALPNDVDFTSLTRFYNLILKVDFLILSNGFSSHIFCSCTSSTSYYVHSPMFLCVLCILCVLSPIVIWTAVTLEAAVRAPLKPRLCGYVLCMLLSKLNDDDDDFYSDSYKAWTEAIDVKNSQRKE